MLRLISSIAALLALFGLRAYMVLVGAFFGIVVLRGSYGSLQAGERAEAAVLAVLGVGLLVISYRWFAMRWREVRDDPPAP